MQESLLTRVNTSILKSTIAASSTCVWDTDWTFGNVLTLLHSVKQVTTQIGGKKRGMNTQPEGKSG